MTAISLLEIAIHHLKSQGYQIIYGTDTGPHSASHINTGHPPEKGSTQVVLHSSDQVVIERRMTPDADQLVFTTQNHDDTLSLRKYMPSPLGNDVFPALVRGASLPPTTLLLEVNHEKYCILPATKDQALVFITQGGRDFLQIGDDIQSPIIVDSGDDADHIISAASLTTILTGPGDDSVSVFAGSNHIETGPDDDLILANHDACITAYGGPGDDEIIGAGASFIDGGEGNDSIAGGHAHSILSGGPGNDSIEAGASSNVIFTGEGADSVTLIKPDDMTYHNMLSELAVKFPTSPEEWERVNAFPDGQLASGNLQLEPGNIQESGIIVRGSQPFVERINDDLRLLHSSPTGQKLLAVLHQAALDSENPVSINELNCAFSTSFVANPATRDHAFIENGQRGAPSYGAQIWFNTADAQPHEPSIIRLFHELCRAYNHVTGTLLHGISEDRADGDQARVRVSNQELQAAGLPTTAAPFDFDNDPSTEPTTTNPEPFSENGLRKELGLPQRTASRSTQTRA